MKRLLLTLVTLLALSAPTIQAVCPPQCPIGQVCGKERRRWLRAVVSPGNDDGFEVRCRPIGTVGGYEPDPPGGSYQDAACSSQAYCNAYAQEVCPEGLSQHPFVSYSPFNCYIQCFHCVWVTEWCPYDIYAESCTIQELGGSYSEVGMEGL